MNIYPATLSCLHDDELELRWPIVVAVVEGEEGEKDGLSQAFWFEAVLFSDPHDSQGQALWSLAARVTDAYRDCEEQALRGVKFGEYPEHLWRILQRCVYRKVEKPIRFEGPADSSEDWKLRRTK